MADSQNLVRRFRKWFIWALVAGVLLYVAGSVWVGVDEVRGELAQFTWWIYVPVLVATLGNYGLRFGKWHYLLHVLGARIAIRENARIFLAGLAMVISPGKVGELLKPYLVSRRTGVPMATTIPALIAERLTDGIAMLILAAISVGTYASDQVGLVAAVSGVVVLGLLVLASERLSMLILDLLGQLPGVSKIAPKLTEMYRAMRSCLAPVPLVLTIAVSVLAWFLECAGFVWVFRGLGIEASYDVCTFVYAFATVLGGAMPGGLGVADGALAAGAVELIGSPEAAAVTAALLIRVATLWFGVMLGALSLLRFEDLLEDGLSNPEATPA